MFYLMLRASHRTRVLIVSGGSVLLLKPWIGTGKWSLPGGGIHRREDSAVGAVREVREEVSLSFDPPQLVLLGKFTHRFYGLVFGYDGYIIKTKSKLAVQPNPHEIVEAQWLKISDIQESDCEPCVFELLGAWKNS